jgi:hypothetical protein
MAGMAKNMLLLAEDLKDLLVRNSIAYGIFYIM